MPAPTIRLGKCCPCDGIPQGGCWDDVQGETLPAAITYTFSGVPFGGSCPDPNGTVVLDWIPDIVGPSGHYRIAGGPSLPEMLCITLTPKIISLNTGPSGGGANYAINAADWNPWVPTAFAFQSGNTDCTWPPTLTIAPA